MTFQCLFTLYLIFKLNPLKSITWSSEAVVVVIILQETYNVSDFVFLQIVICHEIYAGFCCCCYLKCQICMQLRIQIFTLNQPVQKHFCIFFIVWKL